MANNGVMVFGLGLLVLTGIGWFAPVTVEGYTYPQLNGLCNSGFLTSPMGSMFGQLMFGEDYRQTIAQECKVIGVIITAIIGIGIIGVLALIGGWWLDAPKKEDEPEQADTSLEILKERYAKGEITKDEFEKMKKEFE